MASQIKSFTKGMSKDLDYKISPNEIYIDAHNIRLINDVAGSSMSLNNIRGNQFNITIPNTTSITQLTIIGNSGGNQLKINGQTGNIFGIVNTYKELYDIIINDSNYTTLGIDYNIYYGDSQILIVPVSNNSLTASVLLGGDINVTENYIKHQDNLVVIGSTTIRGDIYLFTTNSDSKTPTDACGQIWKYTYDKILYSQTLELKYNNKINFSTYWCIAPTATLGRYENSQIQRIYWTDNYNKLRSLNVADKMCMAIAPSILDITPSVNFDIPILTNVSVELPVIKTGVYQMAYRLKNTGGAVTTFSELSNQVYVCDGNFGADAWDFGAFVGGNYGTSNGNVFTWTINNVDRNYDRIECAIVFRDTLTGTPTVILMPDVPIINDTMSIIYNGNIETTPITMNEFLAMSGVFTHCKTIATKDNRLFVANVRNTLSELEFDARAYRAKNSGNSDIYLTNNGNNAIHTLSDLENISLNPETNDNINEYNTGNECKYFPGTNYLGGQGLNIEYEFVAIATQCDRDLTGVGTFEVNPLVSTAPLRWPGPNTQTEFIDLGISNNGIEQRYTNTFNGLKLLGGFKYPDVNGVLKGYQRNEVYRFGIQFFDKAKNPYFVKWIGDIKMPDFEDKCIGLNGSNNLYEDGKTQVVGVDDFRLSFIANQDGYEKAFVQSLGIKFVVKGLQAIGDKISGYTIVRVKREEKDKTITGEGIITRMLERGSDTHRYMPTLRLNPSGNGVGDFGASPDNSRAFFITPDVCQSTLASPQSNYKLKIKAVVSKVNANYSTGIHPYYYFKDYNFTTTPDQTLNIEKVSYFGFGTSIIDNYGITINNFDYNNDGFPSTLGGSNSLGNPCYYLKFNGSLIDWGPLLGITTDGKYLCRVERTVLNQYGGNTYINRSNNEYISTCNFISTNPLINSNQFYNYGGDVFVNMYDSCRYAKNVSGGGLGPGSYELSSTFFFPVESAVNTELRNGVYMNRDFNSQLDGGQHEYQETYTYNPIYSSENTVRTYFPKPDPFIVNEEYDNRFYCSDIKINGELTDSWGAFKETNVWDVEGDKGPINAITTLADKLYFFQDRAFGIMEVNPRSVVTDVNNTSNGNLQLGKGLPLQRHDYISTEIGLQHQWGLTKSSYKLFWTDASKKKFYSFGGQLTPESDIKGMFSYLNDNLTKNILTIDKPTYHSVDKGLNGIRAVYDYKYNQAIFTFTDGYKGRGDSSINQTKFTLVFDEAINAFVTFASYTPDVYITDYNNIFSTNPEDLNKFYIHDKGHYGKFYENIYPSTIKFPVNQNPITTKTFGNISFDSQVKDIAGINKNDITWTRSRIYNDYQNTDWFDLIYNNNIKRKERSWRLDIQRNKVLYTLSNSPDIFTDLSLTPIKFGNRMRDKYAVVDLEYNNSGNNSITCNNIYVTFEESPR